MQQKKIRLGILFGGRSAEHEISLLSAKNVIDAIDRDKYEVFLIAIDKSGEWHLREAEAFLAYANNPALIHLHGKKEKKTRGGKKRKLGGGVEKKGVGFPGELTVASPKRVGEEARAQPGSKGRFCAAEEFCNWLTG